MNNKMSTRTNISNVQKEIIEGVSNIVIQKYAGGTGPTGPTGGGITGPTGPGGGSSRLRSIGDVTITNNKMVLGTDAVVPANNTIIRSITGATLTTAASSIILGNTAPNLTTVNNSIIIAQSNNLTNPILNNNQLINSNNNILIGNCQTSQNLTNCISLGTPGLVDNNYNVCNMGDTTVNGNDCVLIGFSSEGGDRTVSLGSNSATNITGAIAIGYNSKSSAINSISIGYNSFTNVGADNSITIGINKTNINANSVVLWPGQAIRNFAGLPMHYNTTTGEVTYFASSRKTKDNIVPIDVDTTKMYNLQPVSFNYKNDPTKRTIGLIAEDVNEIFPEIVQSNEDGPAGINYDLLTVILIEENKKLRDRLAAAEEKINDILSRI